MLPGRVFAEASTGPLVPMLNSVAYLQTLPRVDPQPDRGD